MAQYEWCSHNESMSISKGMIMHSHLHNAMTLPPESDMVMTYLRVPTNHPLYGQITWVYPDMNPVTKAIVTMPTMSPHGTTAYTSVNVTFHEDGSMTFSEWMPKCGECKVNVGLPVHPIFSHSWTLYDDNWRVLNLNADGTLKTLPPFCAEQEFEDDGSGAPLAD